MEVLNGFVENIVFKSEDTGYVVCRIRADKDLVSAVGTVPFMKEGQNVKLTGYWTVHKQFGNQFNIQDYEEVMPNSLDGIEKYLYIRINTEGGAFITAKVNQSYWEKAEVSVQEAWSLAKKNTNKESFVMGLAEYIAKKYGKDMATMLFPNKTPFYVVTNKSEYKGASAILNKKMLSEFGRKYNINKVVVIPSSIHEMFILSADILESVGMKELTKMVQYVNKNEVSDKEQLSDRAYILDI